MGSFPAQLELGDVRLGLGFLRVLEGGDGSPSHIADSPDHPHAGTCDGLGPQRRRLRAIARGPSRGGTGCLVQTKRLGRFGGRAELMSVECASCHEWSRPLAIDC